MATGNATVKWRTVSGVRFASGDQTTLSVDLSAWPHPDEGIITQVSFTVSGPNGDSTVIVEDLELRQPNYTTRTSPLPGVSSGFAPLWCYGTTVNLTAQGGGTITVSATVRSSVGGIDYDTSPASIITIYNDTDGTDRRPCDSTIYVAATGGDNGNPGTALLPKATISGALNALVAADGVDLRGGRIVLQAGDHSMGGAYGVSNWHTTGAGWLEIEFASGATITRTYDGSGGTVYPDSFFLARANGAGTTCRVRVMNPTIRGSGFACSVGDPAATCIVWIDGGVSKSWADDGSTIKAAYYDYDGDPAGFDDGTGNYWFATQHTRQGCTDGFSGTLTHIHDCKVSRILGIACYANAGTNLDVCNLYVEQQDYIYANAASQARGIVEYTGSANLTIGTQSGGAHDGKMRITMTSGSPPFDVFAEAGFLVGSLRLGLVLSGATTGGNNGVFAVLEAGSGYMILDKASPTNEVGGASFKMVTARKSDGTDWNTLVHPNCWRVQGNQTGLVVQNLACSPTYRNSQGLFSAGYTLTRCVFDEVVIPENLRGNFDGSVFVDCTFRYVTLAGPWDWGGGTTAAGCVFHDCVAGSSNNWPTATAQTTRSIHRISGGSVGGTNPTSGSWFDGDPDLSYLPAPGVRGNDSVLGVRAPAARWSTDTAWSQGCGAWPCGNLSWQTSATASASITLGLTMSAAGELSGGSGGFEQYGTITGVAAITLGLSSIEAVGTGRRDIPPRRRPLKILAPPPRRLRSRWTP